MVRKEGQKEEIKGLEDRGEVITSLRELSGKWQWVVYIIGISASIFHIWVNTIGVMPGIYRNAVHLGFILTLAFLFYPMFRRKPEKGFAVDLFFALLTCVVAVYILLFEEELHLERGSVPIMRDYVFAAIAIVILLFATYRASGWIIPLLSIIFLAYALFLGKYIPGSFHYRGVALGRLLYRMYLTDEGIFGIVCTISATYVYLFILFGAFLLKSGAGDFIIKLAHWTGIPYLHIIAVSAIPAVMYFLSVYFFVHVRALKRGMKPVMEEDIPKVKTVLKEGAVFLFPVALLVLLLIRGFTPTYAACIAMLSIIVVSWLRKETRMGLKDILDALYIGAKNSVSTATILICAEIVIGIVGITGVGVTFSGMVIDLSGGHLFWAIILVCLASLFLGMGLPVTASYIFLAVLAAPALKELGISLLAAHMIIFWYSQDANVTPPVCLAAYSAAGIAGSKPMETGLAAWRLAKGLYIIPLLFAYTPLLFEGPVHEVLITAVSATLGLYAFTVTTEGYMLYSLCLCKRGLMGLSTLGLLWPNTTYRIVGLLILGSMYLAQKLAVRREVQKAIG